MKEAWIRPLTEVQKFVANEYVAACGVRPDGTYIFKCDAPKGNLYIDGRNGYAYLGSYHPCGKTHTTKNPNYSTGWVDYNNNGRRDSNENVLVWRGESGMNGHATKSLTEGEINTVRS